MEVVFNNISDRIIEEIKCSALHLQICVAWLTNKRILEALIEHSKKLKFIEIIVQDNEENRRCSLYFNKLIANEVKVYFIKPINEKGIIHHKFCVIDDIIVINGSFNWSQNAENNNENITIVESEELAIQYIIEFNNILIKTGVKTKDQDKLEYFDEYEKTEEIMQTIYPLMDKTFKLISDSKYDEAQQLINALEIIWPKHICRTSFYYCKHLLNLYKRNILDSYFYLLKILESIAINDINECDSFKNKYEYFIKYTNNSYSTNIHELNDLTYKHIDLFNIHSIKPHIFSVNDWPLPF
jgi:hypothetical protein